MCVRNDGDDEEHGGDGEVEAVGRAAVVVAAVVAVVVVVAAVVVAVVVVAAVVAAATDVVSCPCCIRVRCVAHSLPTLSLSPCIHVSH